MTAVDGTPAPKPVKRDRNPARTQARKAARTRPPATLAQKTAATVMHLDEVPEVQTADEYRDDHITAEVGQPAVRPGQEREQFTRAEQEEIAEQQIANPSRSAEDVARQVLDPGRPKFACGHCFDLAPGQDGRTRDRRIAGRHDTIAQLRLCAHRYWEARKAAQQATPAATETVAA